MPIDLRSPIRNALRLVGLDVHRYNPQPRPCLLDLYGVETIFDIGANVGMSAEAFRASGFRHTIVSFEPIRALYVELERRARSDPLWHTEQLALGSQSGYADIHVTGGHALASSLLEMTDNFVVHWSDHRVVRSERVQVSTIDEVINKHYPGGDRLFLKIDVQGYERRVLDGARTSLPRIVGMKLELSLVENYRGESLLMDMLPLIYSLGFRAVAIEKAWANESTRELVQVDVTCFRTERAHPGT